MTYQRSNLPGLEYVRRMATAYAGLLERQAAQAETLWDALKNGDDVVKTFSRALTRGIETYYDLMVEASKGPAASPQPEWVYFHHTKQPPEFEEGTARPPRLQAEPRLYRTQPAGTSLETTDFVSLQRGVEGLPGTSSAGEDNLYDRCQLSADRKAVSLRLKVDEVDRHPPGQYLSFVTARNVTGQSPLLIVVLVISAAREGAPASERNPRRSTPPRSTPPRSTPPRSTPPRSAPPRSGPPKKRG